MKRSYLENFFVCSTLPKFSDVGTDEKQCLFELLELLQEETKEWNYMIVIFLKFLKYISRLLDNMSMIKLALYENYISLKFRSDI